MNDESTIISPLNNPLIRLISDKKFRWLRHASFLILGFILAFKGDIGVPTAFRSAALSKAIIRVDVFTFIFLMSLLYLLIRVLIPRLLFKSRIFLFAISILAMITLIYFVAWWTDIKYLLPLDRQDGAPQIEHIEFSLLSYIQLSAILAVLLGAVVGMSVFKKWITDVQRMNELHQTNLRTELEQLKSQVNPHFLFNTLNNLMVLTKTDPEKASQVLLGLSDLLRYLLYDSSKDKIMMSKDLAFIQNLLTLEKIRKNDFAFEIHSDQQISNLRLPPFLFIPFVENAIKHGASTIGHSYLNLNFQIIDHKLHFTSENSKPAVKNNTIGGLGLKNIRRRLELLYPDSHILEINEEKEKYFVHLILSI